MKKRAEIAAQIPEILAQVGITVKPISKSKFKVKGEETEIELDRDGGSITVWPGKGYQGMHATAPYRNKSWPQMLQRAVKNAQKNKQAAL